MILYKIARIYYFLYSTVYLANKHSLIKFCVNHFFQARKVFTCKSKLMYFSMNKENTWFLLRAKFDALLGTPTMVFKIKLRFSKGVLSKLFRFALFSEIQLSEEFVKIGTIIELQSFSHKFSCALLADDPPMLSHIFNGLQKKLNIY